MLRVISFYNLGITLSFVLVGSILPTCAGIMLPTKITANHSNLINVLMILLFISVLEDESAYNSSGALVRSLPTLLYSSDLLCKIQKCRKASYT
jgi:hypothetical protein